MAASGTPDRRNPEPSLDFDLRARDAKTNARPTLKPPGGGTRTPGGAMLANGTAAAEALQRLAVLIQTRV